VKAVCNENTVAKQLAAKGKEGTAVDISRKYRFFGIASFLHSTFNKQLAIFKLNSKVIGHIMSYLLPAQLCACACVCKEWKSIGEQNSLWTRFYEKEFGKGKLTD
jgi:hypothetical protein